MRLAARRRPPYAVHRSRSLPGVAVAALALLARVPGAGADSAPPESLVVIPHEQAPALEAARSEGSIHVDGRLEEAAWQAARPATRFTQLDPEEGRPASERSEVRVLVSGEAICVGARLYDREPGKIRTRLARRDESSDSDLLDVLLDSQHDHRTAFVFTVNPAGAFGDAQKLSNGTEDPSWDPVWECAARIDSLGWTAEMKIPLSQLRYNARGDGVWGIQIRRTIQRRQELDLFSFFPKKVQGGPSRFGHLTGLTGLPAPRRLELLPYSSARSENAKVARTNPFRDGSDQFGAAGLDLKYGLTSSLTLAATVNPDFGQVEVDPAVVNLSAFETIFPEKRPFFVEGTDLFRYGEFRNYNSFGLTEVFHSRRVGRTPQRAVRGPDVAIVDAPVTTTIDGAVKLTGRAGGWALGVLEAVTPTEHARYLDTSDLEHDLAVEPRSNYFVGRARRDLRHGDTALGAILTAVNRDLSSDDLGSLLRARAFVGGVDFAHAWANRAWSLDGSFTGSDVEGGASAIARTQRTSAHYFQRPDARSFTYDPSRTRLTGWESDVALSRLADEHWVGSLALQQKSPGFEANDLGYLRQADQRQLSPLVLYQQNRPGPIFRSYDSFLFTNHQWNFDGEKTFEHYAGVAEGLLRNYWSVSTRYTFAPSELDDRLTRGGPLGRQPVRRDVQFDVTSDSRRPYVLSAHGGFTRALRGDWQNDLSAALSVRPMPQLRLRFEPQFTQARTFDQYVATVLDPEAAATYGSRYVFGTIDQTTLALVTRTDWTFTPALSLQLYLQPLVVSGKYRDFKELAAPREDRYDIYGKDHGTIAPDGAGGYTVDPDGPGPAAAFGFLDPNFNLRSLIGNAVLRWQYRPGSAMFFVWQQNREGVESFGDFGFSRDVSGIFHRQPSNVFAVRLTYWLGV